MPPTPSGSAATARSADPARDRSERCVLTAYEDLRRALAGPPRALITRPDLVLADDPTGALDSRTGARELSPSRDTAVALGQTVLVVTHDPVVASYAHRRLRTPPRERPTARRPGRRVGRPR
ncbi:hypothetical protein KIK06_01285 [Nocardiopsis sp. EMB25]|uniref:hypothetical protein n=1 Tax=Nocardiopsis sp. EMB25 TaxID=2835867 RepID=UPI0022840EA5|nr:hypothetical protein [Nocardiopsis sp. EMB25]MCY9782520.1 hypothetical protein [Nocardiopsis sp. EMB25]